MSKSRSHFKIYSTSQAAWDAMRFAVANAQESIYWEMYICIDDDAGRKFFDLFEQKAKLGVNVKLIVDGLGSFRLSKSCIDRLRAAGVDIHIFHDQIRPYRGVLRRLLTRTHRKILVVDENIGFIGGVNVEQSMRDWLDLHVRLEGPAVHSLLRAFAKMYLMCGGERRNVLPLLRHRVQVQPKLRQAVDFIYDNPHRSHSRMRYAYLDALRSAHRRVVFLSPYYFPDKEFLHELWQARCRGVRVDLLIPFRTDVRISSYAAYAWFAAVTKMGARIHLLYRMMHGKAVLVDDAWAIVGSSNMEPTSYYHNYEANIRIHDPRVMRKLHGVVGRWFRMARRLDLVEWEKRGLWRRLKERGAYYLYRLWHPGKG